MLGFDFHRQKPVGNYIVDFFCPRLKLVIEIDGRSHDEKLAEDSERQKNLEAIGLSVLRFLDYDVKQNSEVVLSAIEEWIKDNKK
jgi:very-short-patch-repair endonuclease